MYTIGFSVYINVTKKLYFLGEEVRIYEQQNAVQMESFYS